MIVLITDDHASMRQTIQSVLTAPGMDFIEAADGPEAIRLCDERQPDWILMDIRMPGMDGIEATREIHRRCPATHIVMVTSYDDPKLREAAVAAGACGYVRKDNLCDLRQLIRPPAGSGGRPFMNVRQAKEPN